MLFAVFTSLLIIGITITSFRAVQGSFWSMFFNWVVAGLLLGLYLAVSGHFPIYQYVDEMMIIALTIALFGNLALVIWISSLKRKYRSQTKAIAMKQNLLAIAAHELRTPITNLRSQADLAVNYVGQKALSDAESILQMSLDDLDTLDHHVKAILALAALENGTLATHKEWFPVSKIVLDLNSQFAGKANVALIWECCKDEKLRVTELYTDYDLIKVVLRNAIENALKHTEDGFVRLSMALEENYVEVTVQDTGSGMSTEEMKALHWHGDALTHGIRRGKDGWGIGIPVMKAFTEFLGGTIAIDSKEGFGTKLSLRLPISYRQGATGTLGSKRESDEVDFHPNLDFSAVGQRDNKLRVLLIDDNETYLQQMHRMFAPKILETSQVQLVTCNDPILGISRLEEERYDLLLVDYHMPQIDGLKLLEWLENDEAHPNQDITKIMVTADPNIPQSTRGAIVKAGARIVSKGMSIEDLRMLVLEAIRQKFNPQDYSRSAS